MPIMKIPSRETCYRLMMEMEMMEHIVRHSLQVCRVAETLARRLRARGCPVNQALVRSSALLHDITKTRSFRTGETHSETGCTYLEQHGYPEVGAIVRQHVRLDHYFDGQQPTEAEIVNYADKRVLHDRIVSLAERMEYILRQYGTRLEYRKRLQWLWRKSIEQEKRLFADLPFSPAELEQYLDFVDVAGRLQDVLAAGKQARRRSCPDTLTQLGQND
jgi:putative nucleotidyltransferase with HDIG domain